MEYRSADLTVEQQRLEALAGHMFSDQAQEVRFTGMMRGLEARNLAPDEVARTYHQINRLLTGGADSSLSPLERGRLAEQIMLGAKSEIYRSGK